MSKFPSPRGVDGSQVGVIGGPGLGEPRPGDRSLVVVEGLMGHRSAGRWGRRQTTSVHSGNSFAGASRNAGAGIEYF